MKHLLVQCCVVIDVRAGGNIWRILCKDVEHNTLRDSVGIHDTVMLHWQ